MKEILAAVLSEDENGNFSLGYNLDEQNQLTPRLDKLIAVLAQDREVREPGFPAKMPLISEVSGVNGPAWQWSMLPDASLVLNLRHPGFGWLSFRLPDAIHLHQQLQVALDEQKKHLDE